MNRTTTEFTLH